jgi:hypothetical protein
MHVPASSLRQVLVRLELFSSCSRVCCVHVRASDMIMASTVSNIASLLTRTSLVTLSIRPSILFFIIKGKKNHSNKLPTLLLYWVWLTGGYPNFFSIVSSSCSSTYAHLHWFLSFQPPSTAATTVHWSGEAGSDCHRHSAQAPPPPSPVYAGDMSSLSSPDSATPSRQLPPRFPLRAGGMDPPPVRPSCPSRHGYPPCSTPLVSQL